MNRVWDVKPDPEQGGVRNFISKRALSMLLILGVAFLLIVSLAMSALLSAFGERASVLLPGALSESLVRVIHIGLSFAVLMGVFATLLRLLPDVRIGWGDVWVGSAATTLLFVTGKFLIGFYLGRNNPGEVFGAAASLAVLLVWIYYASSILLLGAEFTQAWTSQHRGQIEPESGAVQVKEVEIRERATPAAEAEQSESA
jgi:membrane protein